MTVEIPCRNRQGVVLGVAIIDDDDAVLAAHRWWLDKDGYAHRRPPGGRVLLHRVVLGLAPGDRREGDHINGDILDCRRANLRVGTRRLNGQNVPAQPGTSRYRGVSWHTARAKWRSTVKLDGRQHHLGLFDDEDEAATVAAAFRREHMPFTNEERATCPVS